MGLLLFFHLSYVNGQVSVPAILGDNMVLQRGIPVPVWGKAAPNEKVTVRFMGKNFPVTAGVQGNWSVKLDRYRPGGPFIMEVQGAGNVIQIKNILIGDVWLASGQSNMEFGLQSERSSKDVLPGVTDNRLRFFYVPMNSSLTPQEDILNKGRTGSRNGRWIVCSPEAMADPQWAWHGFSAVGYYFARDILSASNVAQGMIGSYKGGTPAQAWMSPEALKSDSSFRKYTHIREHLLAAFNREKASFPKRTDSFKLALREWEGKNKLSPQPPRSKPVPPDAPDGGYSAPSNLYHAMIRPIIGYGIKGVLWYQGESNGDNLEDAVGYKRLFPALIRDWRLHWGQGNLPFLFVQLANYRKPPQSPSEGNWPWVREAQAVALNLPLTGMAVTTDIGEENDIHPTNKRDVGLRLAKAARHLVYGEKLLYSGPQLLRQEIKGNKIILYFKNEGSALMVSTDSGTAKKMVSINGFGIAGSDGKFYWAQAALSGKNKVVLSSPEVKVPVAVRYNWADNPQGNLYNSAGLPAGPFRTDNWGR